MDLDKLKADWKNEEKIAFKGWDFSYLDKRWEEEQLPWDYKLIISKYINPSDRLLDMGTGGGEFLLTLNHPYKLTSVTEAYLPNVEFCKQTLSPLGINVRQVLDDNELPFGADQFDIVINRHESFNVNEIYRILKGGGYFITQQVGGKNDNDLSNKLIDSFIPRFANHDLKSNVKLLQDTGFDILLSEEAFPTIKFFDVGALVYFARIIEWEFTKFSVDSCFENLCVIQKVLQENGFIKGTEHRFVIVAKKK